MRTRIYSLHVVTSMHITACLLVIILSMSTVSKPFAQLSQPATRVISYQGSVTTKTGTTLTGEHTITATLYSDQDGKTPVWSGSYKQIMENGIFSVLLGSGEFPLPKQYDLSKPLWIGIRIDNGEEMQPYSQLTGAPYAISIPDKSVTKEKLSDDVLQVINHVRGNQDPQVPFGSLNYWDEQGNNLNAGTEFIGSLSTSTATTDVQIHVDNGAGNAASGRVMLYNRGNATTSPNITGGFNANTIAAVDGSVIAGGGSTGNVNTINSDFSFIGGGENQTINASANHSVIGGGENHSTSNHHSTIAGGLHNTASGIQSFVGGGIDNTASGSSATVAGGDGNTAAVSGSAVVGGDGNSVTQGMNSFIGAGFNNTINHTSNDPSVIGGGTNNTIDVDGNSFIGGGSNNHITNWGNSVIGGGTSNLIDGAGTATIAGGSINRILGNTAHFSTVGGGALNTIEAFKSVIPGGWENSIILGADFSVIGGGTKNIVNVVEGTILGGENNRTTLAGQVVGGYWNATRGTSPLIMSTAFGAAALVGGFGDPAFDAPLFTLGNGASGARHNAFEVSYNGHSIVTDINGPSAGAGRPAIQGATYDDNIIYAWGDITAAGGIVSEFGVFSVQQLVFPGPRIKYLIVLDQILNNGAPAPGTQRVFTDGSVTATIEAPVPTDPYANNIDEVFEYCTSIASTKLFPIQIAGVWHTAFIIYISKPAPVTHYCESISHAFMFKVTGRKNALDPLNNPGPNP